MKQKLILCTFIITSLLLTGCSRGNVQGAEMSSENTMISEEEAQNIALAHAGLAAEQVNFIKNNMDMDDGRRNFDVEFYTKDGREYDYEIDPYSGEILNHDFDAEYYVPSSATPETAEDQKITADSAKQIALDRVPGATEQDIREFKSDYDDGRLHYEGTIYYEQMKYEFEIDGVSGDVREWNVETIYD